MVKGIPTAVSHHLNFNSYKENSLKRISENFLTVLLSRLKSSEYYVILWNECLSFSMLLGILVRLSRSLLNGLLNKKIKSCVNHWYYNDH